MSRQDIQQLLVLIVVLGSIVAIATDLVEEFVLIGVWLVNVGAFFEFLWAIKKNVPFPYYMGYGEKYFGRKFSTIFGYVIFLTIFTLLLIVTVGYFL
ncbi:MAG: hypothetical protein HY272_10345 [Gammaproteobacteria bacterium]|nr:hypothetical protein [Gammaproteobacteria bacterium]